MKQESGGWVEESGKDPGSVQQETRTCPVCGTKCFATADGGFCPVCILRGASGGESAATGEPGSLSGAAATTEEAEGGSQVRRFENYEVILDEAGRPIELGRGAMGVTYKAFDVDLRCPVTLKVIRERYLGDESAQLRFLREARAAASVRHPNVASVLHLGRTGSSYFYAMEFVEGETLEHFIRRSGRVEVKLALEIVAQVAAGLAAVQEQNLVHRDLKPSNIMLRLKNDGSITAKIIDLGLAKSLDEPGAQAAISTPGAFAGTPEFASPEQFAGIGADIRSDLYSLGVVLWEMLTGKVPFNGPAVELMYQHLHTPPPAQRLKNIPQPAIALLEILLKKDPTQRFQTPNELLNAMPTVKCAIEAKRTIKHQEIRTTSVDRPISRQEKSPAVRQPKRSIAVLPFDTLSHGKGNTYFADGVQDEILSNLAKVSRLKVISRTSVMTFRPGDNRNLRSIAESLGVANVVEGTVRKDGKRVRITIRLVDARIDKTLWSESYDRDLTDIFVIQSEVAQTIAGKLTATLSPDEKKWIEAKPTNSLGAYDLYLRAKELFVSVRVSMSLGDVKKPLVDAIGFLDQAVRLDPKFTLAYCASAHAHDNLFFLYDFTPERRAFADAAVNNALDLQPDLPEVHLAYASHLYLVDRNYERARVQLAIARRDLPNDAEAIALEARIDRRQGQFEKAIREFNETITRDPRNIVPIQELADTLYYTRRFRAAEQAFDRMIDLRPDLPILKVRKQLYVTFYETGDASAVRAAIAALPTLMFGDRGVLSLRLMFALVDRNWPEASELIEKMKGGEEVSWFAYGDCPVPVGCYSIMLTRLQGEYPDLRTDFAETREQLEQKIQESPGNAVNACLLSDLAVVDALLGQKEVAVAEAKRAIEMLPVSKDALNGPGIVMNLAVVYAWTNEADLAFEKLGPLTEMPFGIFHGQLKRDPYWDPLRSDPRFDKLLAQLAPNQSLRKTTPAALRVGIGKPPARQGPKKISVARLPVTGSDLFGREEDIAFLDHAWANRQVNVATIVAWAGVGKSTLVNHWLRRMAAEHYRSAQLVFGWSFYRQGTSGGTSSADEFLDAALTWFGDPDPRIGTAWEKGERLAKLVGHRRTLLVLDGLEPLQNPPGAQEGRLREPALQALLRELAAFNTGLCVITTRLPVADIADHERTSALRRDLERLSKDAGASLLRALGVKGDEAELQSASEEFRGHCLALTLLGSYLTDACKGNVRRREEVSARLAHDLRHGAHARKVMESYQTWLGEGPELAILRMLGLFDRPADEQAFGVLLKLPAIPGLTESLTDLRHTDWQTILAKLRRAKLLAREDPHNPGQLDTHPLVREYFGEQLRSQQMDAWKECNRRLFHYYRTLTPQLPDSFREMEPLFSAVICGCNAGLFREALHEVYIPRIQRGDTCFAANVLGATAPLLTVLVHFFEHGRWGSLVGTAIEAQSLTAEDQLFILMQAGLYLMATRGMGSPEPRICFECAEPLCHSLNQPRLLSLVLGAQFRHTLMTDKLSAAIRIAERLYSRAQEQNDAWLTLGVYSCFAATLYFSGEFETARQNAMRGVQIWRSGDVQSYAEEYLTPVVICLTHWSVCEWHFGEIASCHALMDEGIAIAQELKDMNALAMALSFAAILANQERDPAEVDRWASEVVELCTRQNFLYWLANGQIYYGWARSALGKPVEGISWIEQGIRDIRATGTVLALPAHLASKAEALYLAGRTTEALEAINEAEAMAERYEQHVYCSQLHWLRGVFLTAMGVDETQIEPSFQAAIRIAKEQKSVSLQNRAEATYAEYRRQKASGSGGRGFQLPL